MAAPSLRPHRLLLLLVSGLVSACGTCAPKPEAPPPCAVGPSLSGLREGTLFVGFSPGWAPEDRDAPTLSVFLQAHPEGMREDNPLRLHLAPKARASFNGAPLKRMRGVYALGDLSYSRDCGVVELVFPGRRMTRENAGPHVAAEGLEIPGPIPISARTPDAAELVIEDETARWSIRIPDAFTPRRLTVVSPADGVLRRGQPVELRWSPASDEVVAEQSGLALHTAQETLADGVTLESKDLRIEGDRIHFTVPADLSAKLNGPVKLQWLGRALIRPALAPCPVAECRVSVGADSPGVEARLAP